MLLQKMEAKSWDKIIFNDHCTIGADTNGLKRY